MIKIQTRQNRHGNWWCNGTIDGYDHSFEGKKIQEAQEQMLDLLKKKSIPLERTKWELPRLYDWPKTVAFIPKPQERPWLDKGMV